MHDACYETYRRSNSKCPACGEDWGRGGGNHRVILVGEGAAPKDDWPRRSRRTTTTESEEEDEKNDEGDEEEEVDAPAPAPPATMPDRSQAGSSQARPRPRRGQQLTASTR
jgi:hypothetical protein